MRQVLNICRRELLAFFVSPIAYFLTAGFILLGGYFFFMSLGVFNYILAQMRAMPYYRDPSQLPNLNYVVVGPFYQTLLVILVFVVPLLTMRVFAEERRRGTFELLVTSPLSVGEIVVGKLLSLCSSWPSCSP
jgi:ABC-2 type transport system permease protein